MPNPEPSRTRKSGGQKPPCLIKLIDSLDFSVDDEWQ
jgi:hypothetical protein